MSFEVHSVMKFRPAPRAVQLHCSSEPRLVRDQSHFHLVEERSGRWEPGLARGGKNPVDEEESVRCDRWIRVQPGPLPGALIESLAIVAKLGGDSRTMDAQWRQNHVARDWSKSLTGGKSLVGGKCWTDGSGLGTRIRDSS